MVMEVDFKFNFRKIETYCRFQHLRQIYRTSKDLRRCEIVINVEIKLDWKIRI